MVTKNVWMIVAVVLFAAWRPAAAAAELRTEWLPVTCPKGLPQADAEEGAQKLAPILAGLITAIAPKLISGGVDLAAKKLQAAGEDRADVMSARSDEYFYQHLRTRKNVMLSRCLVVVEAADFTQAGPFLRDDAWRNGAPRVGGYREPRMIFMAAVEAAPEGKLFRLVPTYLDIREWRARSFSSSKRDYSFTVSLSSLGTTATFASTDISLKAVPSTGVFTATHPLLASSASSYVPLPTISAEGAKHIRSVEEAWAPVDRAAFILNSAAKRAAENAKPEDQRDPGPEPSLYLDGNYISRLNTYCDAVKAANSSLPAAKREVPHECNWRAEIELAKLHAQKSASEVRKDAIDWAKRVCWPKPEERAAKYKPMPDSLDEGYECASPGAVVASAKKEHTRVWTLVAASEVIPGSKTAKFLGDALAASKDDVSKVIVDRIPPLTGTAKDAEDVAERAKNQAMVEADYKVQLAQAELDELADGSAASKVIEKRMKLQAAWNAANTAYRAAGRVAPYPEGAL